MLLRLQCQKLPNVLVKKSDKNSRLEAPLALNFAFHSPTLNCDHLTEMLKSTINDSKSVSSLQMKRTKCSEIIKNDLGPYFHNDLIEGDENYRLLLAESNGITVNKILGISVIYFSKSNKKIISTFLNLIELEVCTADAIANALKHELLNRKFDLAKLVAIGADNASVTVEVNNGVFSKLKKEIPRLLLFRCLRYSLQSAVSHASSECLSTVP